MPESIEIKPNPVPHWHVSRPPWVTERRQQKKRMVTVWPSLEWANEYVRRLPERWIEAFRVQGRRKKFCFEEDGRDKVIVTLTAPNMPSNKASLWLCLKTDCYEGQGVED